MAIPISIPQAGIISSKKMVPGLKKVISKVFPLFLLLEPMVMALPALLIPTQLHIQMAQLVHLQSLTAQMALMAKMVRHFLLVQVPLIAL